MTDTTARQLAVMPGPAGTSGLIDADSIRALVAYMEQRDGVRDVLGCGCTNTVECGYHRQQSERTRGMLASPRSRAADPRTAVR